MLALVIVAAGLLYPAPAGAAVAESDTLDQSQTAASTFQCWIGGSTPSQWAQIVTASQYSPPQPGPPGTSSPQRRPRRSCQPWSCSNAYV
jgi:hypothetical protein